MGANRKAGSGTEPGVQVGSTAPCGFAGRWRRVYSMGTGGSSGWWPSGHLGEHGGNWGWSGRELRRGAEPEDCGKRRRLGIWREDWIPASPRRSYWGGDWVAGRTGRFHQRRWDSAAAGHQGSGCGARADVPAFLISPSRTSPVVGKGHGNFLTNKTKAWWQSGGTSQSPSIMDPPSPALSRSSLNLSRGTCCVHCYIPKIWCQVTAVSYNFHWRKWSSALLRGRRRCSQRITGSATERSWRHCTRGVSVRSPVSAQHRLRHDGSGELLLSCWWQPSPHSPPPTSELRLLRYQLLDSPTSWQYANGISLLFLIPP